jgi:hypothetical protein
MNKYFFDFGSHGDGKMMIQGMISTNDNEIAEELLTTRK